MIPRPPASLLPELSTRPIALDVENGTPVTIRHGLGRHVYGWLVIWQTAAVSFAVQNAAADTRNELVLVPAGTGSVRLVLL